MEINTGNVVWSFTSGPSIYSSYQELPVEGDKHNASKQSANFFIDCGDDWELYMHSKDLKEVKLPFSAEELIARTPYVSADGIMLGTKKTTVFLVDAKSGTVIHTFRSDDLSSAGGLGTEETPALVKEDVLEWLQSTAADFEAVDQPLYIKRTDYGLKYSSSKTGKVLWYLMFADIEASYQCQGVDNAFGGTPSKDFEFGAEYKGDMKLPVHCQTKPLVYRVRDHSLLESILVSNGFPNSLPGGRMLSLPAPDQPPPLERIDKLLVPHQGNEGKETLLALPAPETESLRILGLPSGDDSKTDISVPPENWSDFSVGSLVLFFTIIFSTVTFVFYRIHSAFVKQRKLNKQDKDLKVPDVISRKKKTKRPGSNKSASNIERMKKDISQGSTGGKNGLLYTDRSVMKPLLTLDYDDGLIDGRKIGKLLVSNKVIAKGSNGTIVLEGIYDGRPVAVKRLVQTHHDVALKEIQNLIASDQHPNIVRWYGVEYDQDFVYLSLERCTCSLDDLILSHPNSSKNQIIAKDGDGNSVIALEIFKDFELWKANGYPSPQLLKVMRDVVVGLAHLHELGIIHRDLKPPNVLIRKERALSAKVSDMGISKRLAGDMSSLTKQTTGYGTSGWQAPEQLRHERQTRAVDLFSLGCVLFFCVTGGRHPFGDTLERDINIVNNRKDLFLVETMPEALDLISQLLDPNPELRPKAVEVLNHPMFWSSEMRLSFLRDASDRVELEDRVNDSELLKALESIGPVALGGKWDEKMETAFINDIGRYRRYKFDSVRDLLRVIRNKLNHYRELSNEIQELLGHVPEGFESYFSNRFPKLLIEVYKVLKRYCGEEKLLLKYFRSIQD